MTGSKLPTMIVAGLMIATVALPAAAAQAPNPEDNAVVDCLKYRWTVDECVQKVLEDPSSSETTQVDAGTVDCVVEHLKNDWFVGNCLSQTQSSTLDAGPGETLDCLYEHLKNGWFVGNCLH